MDLHLSTNQGVNLYRHRRCKRDSCEPGHRLVHEQAIQVHVYLLGKDISILTEMHQDNFTVIRKEDASNA